MWSPDASIIETETQRDRLVLYPPLSPFQFRAMLKIAGKEQAVNDAIAAIEDTQQRAVAEAKLDYGLSFHRDDQLIAALAPVVGLSDEQIDALWLQAKGL